MSAKSTRMLAQWAQVRVLTRQDPLLAHVPEVGLDPGCSVQTLMNAVLGRTIVTDTLNVLIHLEVFHVHVVSVFLVMVSSVAMSMSVWIHQLMDVMRVLFVKMKEAIIHVHVVMDIAAMDFSALMLMSAWPRSTRATVSRIAQIPTGLLHARVGTDLLAQVLCAVI